MYTHTKGKVNTTQHGTLTGCAAFDTFARHSSQCYRTGCTEQGVTEPAHDIKIVVVALADYVETNTTGRKEGMV